MTKHTALAFAALCCVSAANTASAANLQFAPKPSGPMTAINCNPSSITGKWTCKCDSDGSCTYLTIFCTHVIEDYYTCGSDESTRKTIGQFQQFKAR